MPKVTAGASHFNTAHRLSSVLKPAVVLVLFGLLLAGCRMQLGNRLLNGSATSSPVPGPSTPTDFPTESPTRTPVPTATSTLTPTPDLGAVGLPTETAGTVAFDFVATMCKAEWFTRSGALPCPGDENKSDAGFVMQLPGNRQGLAPDFPVLLLYPPQDSYESIFSRYPAFTVQKGDRFRAVLECRAHSFCDVEFLLEYYGANGKAGLAQWPYRFTDAPVVVDFSLDGVAGLKVQFGLSLKGTVDRIDAYGVWVFPHIYRPAS